jgi:hypothetical protein
LNKRVPSLSRSFFSRKPAPTKPVEASAKSEADEEIENKKDKKVVQAKSVER